MRLSLVAVVLAGLALSACDTLQGESSRSIRNAAAGTAEAKFRDRVLPPGVKRGTSEDFISLGDRVFFPTDQYNLNAKGRDILELQAVWLKQYPSVALVVQGHTDERGTREYNLALADRRATSIKNYLVALGVDGSRIKTISYGKEVPFDPRSSSQAWSLNRRGVTVTNAHRSVSRATN